MKSIKCNECNSVFSTNLITNYCDLCRPHMNDRKEETMSFSKLTKLQKELIFECAHLGYAQGSFAKINSTNTSHVEAQVTNEEEGTILGFSIADGETLAKEQDFKVNLAYAKATVKNNPAILKRFKLSLDDVSDELLVEIVAQYVDYGTSVGHAYSIPTVTVRFEYFNKKYDKFCAMTKGSWGFALKDENNFVMGTRKGEIVKRSNSHILELDLEDVFIMEDGYPTGLKSDKVKVPSLVKKDGSFVKSYSEIDMDIISAYAASLGFKLDGKKYRAVIESSALHQMVEPTIDDEREYEDISDGIVAVRPKLDIHRDTLLSKKESANLKYRPVSDDSFVASGNSAWEERKSDLAKEQQANLYAKRAGNGKAAMQIRLDDHANKVLTKNPGVVKDIKALISFAEEHNVHAAIEAAETVDNPKLMLKVARAIKRIHGVQLPLKVYRVLRDAKTSSQEVRGHELIALLNDESTRSKALESMEGNIDLIEDVLGIAESNLKLYNSHKKKYEGIDRDDYNLIEYRAYNLLKKVNKTYGDVA